MSSTLLYLAIVAVWAVVLVPMWLRREPENPASTGLNRLIPRRQTTEEEDDFDDSATEDLTPDTEDLGTPARADFPPPLTSPRPATSIRRAAIIARRRRRTAALILLTFTALLTAALSAAPWWITLPPFALLLGHLTLLRTATKIDQSRRQEALTARRAAADLEPTLEEDPLPTAEIITFTPSPEVFDQYADPDTPRAVGD
ncbi:divisome protein SepX/GlpR [Actinocorallia populi]|uniref:divisome protein SepX/GlpR n=1 Tax=Actinocorallia populi TaxID=2079200 RepID=UPI001300A1EA|nr:hypothetical protein [Actinocorallia populi]